MKAIVTGATSFVGAAAAGELLRQGHHVMAVVRPGSARLGRLYGHVPGQARPRLQVAELDLGLIRGLEGMLRAEGAGWDVWLHMGWGGSGSDSRKNRQIQQENVANSLAAVQVAAHMGCKRFVFTGSQAEYGFYREPVTEEADCRPVSEYGKAKREFAVQAKGLCKKLDMDYVHTRIFSVYGPGDHPWTLVQSCLRAWQQGGGITLGECTQQWNYLYIEDAAEALALLVEKGPAGIYNLAGDDTRMLRGFVEEMYRLCGSRGSYQYGGRPENAEGVVNLIPEIGKIKGAVGWKPKTAFAEGIRKILLHMQGGPPAFQA